MTGIVDFLYVGGTFINDLQQLRIHVLIGGRN